MYPVCSSGTKSSGLKYRMTGFYLDLAPLSPHPEIRLIIFFAAKNGEALYSQQKEDRELAVAQIMNSLLPNSDLK